jgi:four helix bundle protein
LNEANETEYWLELLKETEYLDARGFASIHKDLRELLKLLTSIIKSRNLRIRQVTPNTTTTPK